MVYVGSAGAKATPTIATIAAVIHDNMLEYPSRSVHNGAAPLIEYAAG
ncbi:hypothetical protein HNQ57_001691 [Zhongshania antarctica]|uniref:Uncharacterized protein n=1 Tax=Zhongshania antarctica TaxID=641702 RepID=A0A840R4R5_9GAMM|nr:hypothetical protein [Zhongshania antarctica]